MRSTRAVDASARHLGGRLRTGREALWVENRTTGGRVRACCPAAPDTEYFDVLGNDEGARFGRKRPPQGIARAAPRAAETTRPRVVTAPARAGVSALRPRHPDPSPKSIG
ncbi:hypothetical protein [Streptomyces olivaceus]|uniref:hypothetical protein n=1 Tax=Streptomyces olivaceus TaxID=47716 RepID=UPI004056D710